MKQKKQNSRIAKFCFCLKKKKTKQFKAPAVHKKSGKKFITLKKSHVVLRTQIHFKVLIHQVHFVLCAINTTHKNVFTSVW